MNPVDFSRLDALLAAHPNPKDSLIALLQDVQAAFGYLPEEALLHIAAQTGLPAATLSGVATFYAQFRLTPPGRYQILVCTGTACHVNGSNAVAEAVESYLETPEGRTTEDGLFSWEKVACLGCCSLSPAMMINGRAYGKLTERSVVEILSGLRKADAGGEG